MYTFDTTIAITCSMYVYNPNNDSIHFSDNVNQTSFTFNHSIGNSMQKWLYSYISFTMKKTDDGRYARYNNYFRLTADSLLYEHGHSTSDIQFKGGEGYTREDGSSEE